MIVAGFGFRNSATLDSLRSALAACGDMPLDALATPSDKATSDAFCTLARELDLPVTAVPTEALAGVATLTQSTASLKERGTGSVAEACALLAAGDTAKLRAPRAVSEDRQATCALAQTQGTPA